MGVSLGIVLESKIGLSPVSRGISGMLVMGRSPVVGWEPVQRTRRLDEMVAGPGNFLSAEVS